MNNRELDIIQKSIDGTLSNRDETRLKRLLETDDDFRIAYNSHIAVTEALKRVSMVEPPVELHREVMSSIDHFRYRKSAPTPSFATHVVHFFSDMRSAIIFRYVAGFAIGAVATCLVLGTVYYWPPVDSTNVGGTIGGSVLPGQATSIDHRDFTFMGGSGFVDITGDDGQIYAEIEVDANEPVVINVQFAAESAAIVSIEQDRTASSRIVMDANRAVIAQEGTNRYKITAQRISGELAGFTLSIDNAGGTQIYSLPDAIAENGKPAE